MPKLTYLGHDAFLLEGSKGRLIFDPYLTGNPNAAARPEDIKVDYVLVSHGHGDHLGDAIQIARANDATIISTFELAGYCQSKGVNAHPMHIGGAHEFGFGRVKLTIAHHGNTVMEGDNIISLGPPCGFVVTMDGKNIYHAGDTGLFYDMKLIGEITPLDVALVPIGDNFTMGEDDAVRAVEFLNPKLAIPMHYNTSDVISADPNRFVQRVESAGRKARMLQFGESLEI